MKHILLKYALIQLLLTMALFHFLAAPPQFYSNRAMGQNATEKIRNLQRLLQNRKTIRGIIPQKIFSLFQAHEELYLIDEGFDQMQDILRRESEGRSREVPARVRTMLEKNRNLLDQGRDVVQSEKVNETERRVHFLKKVMTDAPGWLYYTAPLRMEGVQLLRSYYALLLAVFFFASVLASALLFFTEHQRQSRSGLAKEQEYSERMKEWQLLSAGVAHEIKNPLSSISMFAELLSHKVVDREPEREYLGYIFKEIQRLNTIISNFLSFSRPPQIVVQRHDLNELIRETVDEWRKSVPAVSFRFEANRQVNEFYFDRSKIKQVLINVLKNATEALAEAQTVSPIVEIGLGFSGRLVSLIVSDNGPGLTEDPERVIQPFYTSKAQGSGLGLSISFQIMQSHQGSLRISGNGPAGCRVEILIPYRRNVS
ncbi:MAG: histidine kinase dimerization/phospho-acceptor domain-containing protein [Candidatus Wallbacteria bacterium]|nr:histidine kinase dimerization/phospho-acceptor domain-containing protein [Candidatus Wallbacteria bacterium]